MPNPPTRTSFDFRDEDMTGKQYRGPASAPSATAGALRDTTRSALQGNIMTNPLASRDPYPNQRTAPQTPDRSGPNIRYMTADGRSPNDPLKTSRDSVSALYERARSTNDLADRSALLRQAQGEQSYSESLLGSRTDIETTGTRTQNLADIANVRAQSDRNSNYLRAAVDTDIAGGRNRNNLELAAIDSVDQRYGIDTRASVDRDTTRDTLLQRSLSDAGSQDIQRQELGLRREQLSREATGSYTLADHLDTANSEFGFTETDASGRQVPSVQAEIRSLEAALYGTTNPGEQRLIKERILMLEGQPPGGYQGGVVTPTGFRSYAEGGIVEPGAGAPPALAQPLGPDPAMVAKYTQYAEGARAMGLSTIGFDQFAKMAQGAAATAGKAPAPTGAGAPVAMSEGGEVPAGGKMVIDSDPNAPTDSIPAVIDGQTPAALDSGELVFPRHAVLYYGTDKLNKMIAKSKEAQEGGNGESATGLNS